MMTRPTDEQFIEAAEIIGVSKEDMIEAFDQRKTKADETENNIVVFIGRGEVIVTTKKNEAETVHWYFTEWKRNIDEYDRTETDNKAIDISYKANIRVHRTGL